MNNEKINTTLTPEELNQIQGGALGVIVAEVLKEVAVNVASCIVTDGALYGIDQLIGKKSPAGPTYDKIIKNETITGTSNNIKCCNINYK